MNCLICDCKKTYPIYYIEKDRFTDEAVQYYRCNECNLRFVYPQNKDKLMELYKNTLKKDIKFIRYLVLLIPFSLRHKYSFGFIKGIKKGSVLDVGCGEGKLSWLMKMRGWDVTGVEPNHYLTNFARKNYKIDVRNNTFQELNTNSKFNMVLLSATLEHLPDQIETLNKAREYMNEDGYIFVRIPHDESQWYSSTHLFLHSDYSIKKCFDAAGLNIVKMERFERELYVLGVIK